MEKSGDLKDEPAPPLHRCERSRSPDHVLVKSLCPQTNFQDYLGARSRKRLRKGCSSRYFVDLTSMKEHFRSKVHKKRLKQLREAPYTQEEAERAAGMGSYIPPKKSGFKASFLGSEVDPPKTKYVLAHQSVPDREEDCYSETEAEDPDDESPRHRCDSPKKRLQNAPEKVQLFPAGGEPSSAASSPQGSPRPCSPMDPAGEDLECLMRCLKQGGVSLIGQQRFLTQEQCRKSFIRRNKNPHINEKVHAVRALQSTPKGGARGPPTPPKPPAHGRIGFCYIPPLPGARRCSDSLAFFKDFLPRLHVGNGGLFLEERAPAVHTGAVPPAVLAGVSSAVNKTVSTRADCAVVFLGAEMSLQ
ncbi:PREDICTED: zinc finger protein 593 [Pygoscelis adeliae]|uniref:zinc finger protein 593 n=1 Tax=Pygoscelis adeliae TaxID=9238 RepID=UPI0004F4F6CC|nr:PREDICTED: zinc finger protein 593 [Pygoscelis adeliae]